MTNRATDISNCSTPTCKTLIASAVTGTLLALSLTAVFSAAREGGADTDILNPVDLVIQNIGDDAVEAVCERVPTGISKNTEFCPKLK